MKNKTITRTGSAIDHVTKSQQPAARQSGGRVQARPQFHLQRILVPLDLSACAEKALQYALPFARQFKAELLLLHVVEPAYAPAAPEMTGMTPVPDTELINAAKEQVERVRGEIEPAITTRSVVRLGGPQFTILDAANEFEVDLIILSTHGRSGLGRLLLGSTAEKIVRHAACPVLIVRETEREFVDLEPELAAAKPKHQESKIEAEMCTGM